MDLRVEWHQPSRQNAAPLERSPWPLPDLAVEDDREREGTQTGAVSFLADCECPDDCLRDHENE